MYTTSFLLTDPVGNNRLSFDTRSNKQLYVPSIMEGSFDDIRVGTEVIFEDFDEWNVLKSCSGLEHFVRMTWHGIPLVLVDNHNHVLYFWYESQKMGIIGSGNTLVHIDEHSDLWANENNLPTISTLEQVFEFTNYQCNVGNYIQPALREGIVSKMLRIEWEGDMDRHQWYQSEPNESIILNLDLDFFAPELDYISFAKKKECILYFARRAKCITVATSPFFINQERAMRVFRDLFEDEDEVSHRG